MSYDVAEEDWGALMEVLNETINLIGGKQVEPVKQGILEFSSTTAMLGLEDLANVANQFETFLLQKVTFEWDAEAAATLSFAMGALLEKMQGQQYGPEFSAGLDEVTLYLSFFDEEAPEEKEEPPRPPEPEPSPATFGTPAEMGPDEAPWVEEQAGEKAPELDQGLLDELFEAEAKQGGEELSPELSLEEELMAEFSFDDEPSAGTSLEEELGLPVESIRTVKDVKAEEHLMDEPDWEETAPTPVHAADEPLPLSPSLLFVEPEPAQERELTVALETSPILATQDDMAEAAYREPAAEPPRLPGPISDAVQFFGEMLKHDPTSRVFATLAEELCARKMWKEAVETCRRGLAFHPHLIRARVLLGWALWNLGGEDEAERELTRARAELEKSGFLYGVLAEIAESRGDSRKATHLRNVHKVLRPGEDRGSPAPLPGDEEAARIGAQEPLPMGILSSLLRGFERKPARAPVLGALFSPTDRQALKKLLGEGALSS
jgi:hypothetical protein